MQYLLKHIVNGTLSQKICRICLSPFGDYYEDLFTRVCRENKEYCIADVLEEVCGIKIMPSDQFKTCSRCFKVASEIYKFYLKVQHNEEILNYYVNEIKNQVDLIHVPSEASTDAICIYVQCNSPTLQEFDYNIDDFPFKEVTKESKLAISNTEAGIQLKIQEIKKADKIDMEKNVILPVSTENKNSMSCSGVYRDVEKSNVIHPVKNKIPKKGKRKRNPMSYKTCSQCPVQYKLFGKLKEHMKTMHNIDLFVCKVCKAIIEDEHDFNVHLQTHRGIYICELCNSVFKKRKTIIAHLEWHEEMKRISQEGAHICEVCGVMLLNEEQLNEHREKKHVYKYTCYFCGRRYKAEISFEKHIKKHELQMNGGSERVGERETATGERWACGQCGRRLGGARALRWHLRLHSGATPHACPRCGRAFVSRARLAQHALCAHEPPARRCPLCPALFHLRSMVNSHIKKVHLKTHKRSCRESKHKYVSWKTKPVPIQELSISIQNEILKLQTG